MLHLTDAEFFALTPRQYSLLLERQREHQKHTEWMVGVLASTVANWSMGAPEEQLQPRHFALPLLQVREKRPRINRRKIAAQIRALFDMAIQRQKANATRRAPPS